MKFLEFLVTLIVVCVALLSGCRDEPTAPAQTPTGLEITADGFTILSGSALQLRAVVTRKDASTEDVTEDAVWSNSPGTVGSVNDEGRFFAFQRQSGRETITAQFQGQTATAEICVTPPVQEVAILPLQPILMAGESLQFKAIATFEDGSQEFVTEDANWSVSPGAMGSIITAGLLQSQGVGTAVVKFSHQLDALNAPVLSDSAVVSIVASEAASLVGLFDMVEIPAGSFIMGDNQGNADEQPEHEVFVDRFLMSKFEITNAQYVDFLNAALSRQAVSVEGNVIIGTHGRFPNKVYLLLIGSQNLPPIIQFTEGQFNVAAGNEDDPVVKMSWYGAMAFGDFYGLRLPTEAEWEKASRGGQRLNYGTHDGSISQEVANCGGGSIVEVGSFAPNPFGLHDMAGNAAEFVFDIYDPNFYSISPSNNPFGPGPQEPLSDVSGLVVWRGGSFLGNSPSCRSSFRGAVRRLPDIFAGEDAFGFRVAK
ncbi:SUMF1/EgtB/PvdO family nonheme iron enzyme [candidate division KSB1 bacterium]|nr:formylglycine-generating enzyme family protein [candidate division KSB1 bacterium]NIR69618.1 formylglycine-generating enzyme family protein [candidate division KSB1 bacterium]NIS27463.1 formylglycine-generating enzyme family protein [candidate division KSB1 bacterium]NIU28177.1 formylglycine-generating enzyme family protein [candidate division KSB1 bacterium]NIU90667.1 SUMF1/EgtB/PvdO family nonheme iron enzyme [candidate division KSB1 bacterium]